MSEKDYIKISGQQYRVEVNMSAAERFQKASGMSLAEYEKLAVKQFKTGKGLSMAIVMFWLHAAIIEGAVLENVPLKISLKKLYEMARPHEAIAFVPILIRHYMGDGADISTEKQKKKGMIARLLKRWRTV